MPLVCKSCVILPMLILSLFKKVQLDGRAEPTNALRLVVTMDPNCAAGALPLDAAPNSD